MRGTYSRGRLEGPVTISMEDGMELEGRSVVGWTRYSPVQNHKAQIVMCTGEIDVFK